MHYRIFCLLDHKTRKEKQNHRHLELIVIVNTLGLTPDLSISHISINLILTTTLGDRCFHYLYLFIFFFGQINILQINSVLAEIKCLAPNNTASKWQMRDSNPAV